MSVIPEPIRDEIVDLLQTHFNGGSIREQTTNGPKIRTAALTRALGELGTKLGCEVGASRAQYPEATQGAWLYDLSWWRSKAKCMRTLVLAAEFENKPGGNIAQVIKVHDDFMKLIQARAEVRLWVSVCPTQDASRQHIQNCKGQIECFTGTLPDDSYIFAMCDWNSPNTLIELYRAKSGGGVTDQLNC